MLMFVGLGNPGEKYINNRHSVGFMFIDYLFKKVGEGNELKYEKKFDAEVAKFTHNNQDYIFVKPQTYMNRSGDVVQRAIAFYKVPLDSVYVVHDELDIPFGKFKIQKGVGPKLHNGLESIENKLETKDFNRIRIGVDNRGEQTISGETYVLQDFNQEEQEQLSGIFSRVIELLKILPTKKDSL